ncbi:MAG: B12-binding domain-containing radical SAM protein [Vallitaleaceae bacterium]|jgi:radical SAM superfamily enzyme YgiQ (UPF0313 family)|nr:B12-binding domain-containing radical SAM protein [Vallitaleaceae bacterium]
MKVALVGINAKFIHSNLGIHSIKQYNGKMGIHIDVLEYTINQSIDDILERVIETSAQVIGFSCYIWNIEIIRKLVVEVHKIMPETFIMLGGPEVSYELKTFMTELPMVSVIIYGEGEKSTNLLLAKLIAGRSYASVNGIAYREGNQIFINPPVDNLDMDEIPFVYEKDMSDYEHKILYYESTRGCPFKCSYCLSSIEKGIRYRSMPLVMRELQFFLDSNVRQVKFVDRTFNCNQSRTKAIWAYIIEHDNHTTNFHFEIAADLLNEAILSILKDARPGLIQLEIGVQSTNQKTLEIVQRVTDFDSLSTSVKAIHAYQNIHVHLDLIAGLPAEGYDSFAKSFNDVYNLGPDQLQLGFLKVLRGSGIKLRADQYGLVYRDYAPYEILKTNDLTFAEMTKLKMVEYVLELYYNAGHFRHTLTYLERFCQSPFHMYEGLGQYFAENEGHLLKHSKLSLYTFLKNYGAQIEGINLDYLVQVLKFDLMLQEKIKKYPEWLEADHTYEALIRGFYAMEVNHPRVLAHLKDNNAKQLSRLCHVEVFDYNMISEDMGPQKVAVVFDYIARNKLNNEAGTTIIELSQLEAMITDQK